MTFRPLAFALAAGLLAAAGVVAAADSAEAQSRSRSRSATITGPNHTLSRGASIYRSPDSASVSRYGSADGHSWSSARSRVTTPTADGYATTAARVGPAGNTQTRTGAVSWDEDSYSRSSNVQTSNGYGYDHQVDAYRTEDGVTVNRSITTNGGASYSASASRPY